MAQPIYNDTSQRRWRRDSRGGRRMLAGIAVLAALTAGGLWYSRTQTDTDAQRDQTLVRTVSGLAVVPVDEKPTITTVLDKSKLNQPFLANAEEGDKVLLYFQAGRAVVYRPSTNLIVNMGPLAQPVPSVFIRNGTAAALPDSLTARITEGDQFTVSSRDSAVKQDYKQTLVVDLAGNRPDIATKLANQIGARVAQQLPDGESRPDADIVVIVGSDFK